MLAFMGTQSFIMMYQAGEGWQYGKRKQSALSNEEFNKQTPLSIMNRQRQELINALPSIKDSMNAMTPLINTIVTQYGDFLAEIIKATPEAIKNATGGLELPFAPAFGAEPSTTKPTDWLPVINGILKFLSYGHIINKIGDDPDPETKEEEEEANKLAGLIIEEEEEKTIEERQKELEEIREQNKFGNVVPPPPPNEGKFLGKITHSTSIAAYQNMVFLFKKQIDAIALQLRSGNIRIKSDSWKSLVKQLKAQQKGMMKHITVSRNITHLKAVANNDWNKRIWKRTYPGQYS